MSEYRQPSYDELRPNPQLKWYKLEKELECPHCTYRVGSGSNSTSIPPKPGDIVLCGKCWRPVILDAMGDMREMTLEDIEKTRTSGEWRQVQAAMANRPITIAEGKKKTQREN